MRAAANKNSVHSVERAAATIENDPERHDADYIETIVLYFSESERSAPLTKSLILKNV